MNEFHLLMLFLGILFLFWGIRNVRIHRNIQSFMDILDLSYPNMKKRSTEGVFIGFLFQKIIFFFRNVYSENSGLNIKGFLIVLASVILCLGANYLFLSFHIVFALIVGIFFGAYFSNMLHKRKIKNEFENTFPEALVVLSGAISSGSNITQALEDCSKSIEGVLAKELRMITRSLSLGDDPAKVFAASYHRLPFSHYYFFLTSLLVSIKSGARIKEVLSRLSTALTKAKSMEKKKEAITSEVRMSSKITAAIPFCFLILMKFISPDNFDYIMNNPSGRYILYYFLASEGIGMLIIMFLMRKL